MRRTIKAGLVVILGLALALPLVLAQMEERELDVAIGKAATAKTQMKQAYGKHFESRDIDGALAAYQDVVTRFPQTPEAAEAQFRIGNVYHWDLIEPENAIKAYQKVIDAYPDMDYAIEATIRMGEAYARLREPDSALAVLRRVTDEYPDSSHAPRAKESLAGILLHDLNRVDEAKDVYDDILAHHADTESADDARLWLVHISQKQGAISSEDAVNAYRSLTEDTALGYHTRASAQYMVAYSYYLTGRLDRAVSEFKEVLSMYPNAYPDLEAEVHYFIGHLYQCQGEYTLARESYQKGLRDCPKSLWTGHLQKRLARVEQTMTWHPSVAKESAP